jgi:2,4-dienoyl-CoA reductase-like NADH-dependent reductase (Old Yellow Enzyme family)
MPDGVHTLSQIHRPVELCGAVLRNRLALAAVTRGMATDEGVPTAEMAAYYGKFARHGVGLIITEGTYVPGPAARTYFGQPGLTNLSQQDAWARIVDSVKASGAHILLQLQHAGPFREPELGPAVDPTGRIPASPSWQKQKAYFDTRAIRRDEMPALIEAFEMAAMLARKAGFDGVEIHGARGYLVDAFLSGTNDRDDDYGGALDNRLRFPAQVVAAVRRQIGPMALSYNLSLYKMDSVDYQPPGGAAEIEHAVDVLAHGGVDIFDVSTRGLDRCRVADTPLVDVVRRASDRIVIAGGGVKSLADVEALLRDSRCDVVSMARSLIANPDILELGPEGSPDLRRYQRGMERIPVPCCAGESRLPQQGRRR